MLEKLQKKNKEEEKYVYIYKQRINYCSRVSHIDGLMNEIVCEQDEQHIYLTKYTK